MGADEHRVSYTERVQILVLPQQADHSLLTEHCKLGVEAFIPVIPAHSKIQFQENIPITAVIVGLRGRP